MRAQVRPGRFKLAWFVAGIAVLPLSVAVAFVTVIGADALLRIFDESWYMALADDLVSVMAVFWLINGICIGVLQKAVVKRFLGVDLGRWTLYSALGALLAGVIAYPCLADSCLLSQISGHGVSIELRRTIDSTTIMLVYLTVLSAVQCIGLHRRVSGSLRWVAAHLGSQLLAMLALVASLNLPGLSRFDEILGVTVSALVVTVVTGIVMQRMCTSNRGAAEDRYDEWAYQPAPAETAASAEGSVWDDAI